MFSSCLAGPHISVSDNGSRAAGESFFAPKLQKKQRGRPGAGAVEKNLHNFVDRENRPAYKTDTDGGAADERAPLIGSSSSG